MTPQGWIAYTLYEGGRWKLLPADYERLGPKAIFERFIESGESVIQFYKYNYGWEDTELTMLPVHSLALIHIDKIFERIGIRGDMYFNPPGMVSQRP